MGKFFNVDVKPDIVAGDISNIIASNKAHVAVDANDIIFDWTAVDVPKGASMLRSITAIVNSQDGAYGSGDLTDYHLIFAKSVNGVAPTTMGATNAAQTACFDLKDHYVGSAILESAAGTGTIVGTAFHVAYHTGEDSATGGGLPLVIDLDPSSGTNVGYDKLYVMGFQKAARGYQTGVLVNGAVTSDTATVIRVDGVDARKIFSPGDTVYVHDVDTAIGVVDFISGGLTAATDGGTFIHLTTPIVGGTDLDDTDELINANPILLKLGFEK